MSYTRLVGYSVIPVLLIMFGLWVGDIFFAVAIGGGIAEAFILAKFFDRRAKPPAETQLPPNVFK